MSQAEIQKQVEYYLGDANLSKDDFFRDLISQNSEGWMPISALLKCNKIKKMGITKDDQISKGIEKSTKVETNKDGSSIRRMENEALPTKTGSLKKREAKAEDKKTTNGAAVNQEEQEDVKVERDAEGRIIFTQQDFENTLIVHYKTTDIDEKNDEDYKVNWKDLSAMINEHYDQIKVVYSRADKYEGDVAISSYKKNKDQYAKLSVLKDQDVAGKKFSFYELKDEELKDFWQKHGGHFQYCIAAKLRLARKNNRKV